MSKSATTLATGVPLTNGAPMRDTKITRAVMPRFRHPETSQSVHAAAHDLAENERSNRSTVLADGWGRP